MARLMLPYVIKAWTVSRFIWNRSGYCCSFCNSGSKSFSQAMMLSTGASGLNGWLYSSKGCNKERRSEFVRAAYKVTDINAVTTIAIIWRLCFFTWYKNCLLVSLSAKELKRVKITKKSSLFFIIYFFNFFIFIYSIYTFLDIIFFHNLQGSKLKLKKELINKNK